jgi:hypothetical protein
LILEQAEIDRIQRLHRTILQLPCRRGRFGELKRCPLKPRGVYTLKPPVPYGQHRELAERKPTRKHAVVDLLYRCEQTVKTVKITVIDVQRQDDENGIAVSWLIHFKKGDHADDFDRDIYLSRNNDFTMDASRQTVKGDAPYLAPLADDLKRAREKATAKRTEPNRSDMALLRAAHRRLALRKHTMRVQARRRLALIERETEKLASELSVEDSAILPASDRVECELSAAAEDGHPPSDAESLVSLEPAA